MQTYGNFVLKAIKNGLVVAKGAAQITSCILNDGASGFCAIPEKLGFNVEMLTKEFCYAKDKVWIWFARSVEH